jgi:hypothetical protein
MRANLKISQDVDRGFGLVKLIALAEKELAEIEQRLKQDALDRPEAHEPLKDAAREGRQFTAQGTLIALPIVFTADKIVQSFADGSSVHHRITAAADGKTTAFFTPVKTWKAAVKDGKEFRARAAELLGGLAPAFITACLAVDKDGVPKSDIRCEWDQAAATAAKEGGAE